MSKLTPLFQTSTKSTRTYTRHSPDCCETIVSQHNRVSRVKLRHADRHTILFIGTAHEHVPLLPTRAVETCNCAKCLMCHVLPVSTGTNIVS